ncbi:MAG: ABC transporter permease [Erysipelotrichaceae bacterium]|nr:ABC transporter permease [Erysipelotrichaceae bacterium]
MDISSLLTAIPGAISQGILWGVMALGVYTTYRILNISDLTVDGSFATGGCVAAVCLVNGLNPFVSLLVALVAGLLAGAITGFLHTRCEIPAILAGILTQLGLYSINLRIMGRSNTPLLKVDTLFSKGKELLNLPSQYVAIIIGVVLIVLLVACMYWFYGTEIGSAIRATGNNERMVESLGVNTKTTKMLGFMIANGLVALSGALVTQSQGYADVKQGTGAIVIGLASIIIGEVVCGKRRNFMVRLSTIVVGSILYRVVVAMVLQMGLSTDDLKLLTAVLVAIALTVPVMLEKRNQNARYKAHIEG